MEVRSPLHSLSRLHARRHVAVPGLRNRSILSSFFLRAVSSLTAGFRADCHAYAPLSDGVTKSPRVAFHSTVSSGRFLFTGSSVRFSSLFWSEVDCRFVFFFILIFVQYYYFQFLLGEARETGLTKTGRGRSTHGEFVCWKGRGSYSCG